MICLFYVTYHLPPGIMEYRIIKTGSARLKKGVITEGLHYSSTNKQINKMTIVLLSGIVVAESLSRTQQIYEAGLRSYLLTSLLLLCLALLLYLSLLTVGVDLLWSVEKARCWCSRAEWVHVDTSPLASLFRNTGTLLGLGLGLHYSLHTHTNRAVCARGTEGAIYRLICLGATLFLLQLFDSAFRPAVHSGALFYVLSFCKSAAVPLATVAVVPSCVTAALRYSGQKLL